MAFGKVFIATSVDGFIARDDGSIDWLPPGEPGEDHGYADFIDSVDGIVMGRGTYDTVLGFEPWPFTKPVVVMSRTLGPADVPAHLADRLRVSAAEPAHLVAQLQAEGWRQAYIDGGTLIRAFLRAGLIGEMVLTRVPVLIGSGRPLFGPLEQDLRLHCLDTRQYANGLVSSRYRVQSPSRGDRHD
ncbi:dihydrofolate reductase family protein [Pseudomonas piscis]|uniref:dihydrofolate reductase family protein n=1 Tax=Pseudomonas piscis TaxID=2614538 RepID=UPI0021D5B665|nr:dihydrofolate reductase family protein [Pseudomonas piscis]MCU7647283.1 dihydrofolate reductase family protein [Pseudomonas piscis]